MNSTSLFEENEKKKHINTFVVSKGLIQYNSYIFIDFIALMLDFISIKIDPKVWNAIGENLMKLKTEHTDEDHQVILYSRDKKTMGNLNVSDLIRKSEQQFIIKHLKTRNMKIPEAIETNLLESKEYSRPYQIHYLSLTSDNHGNYNVAIRINLHDHHLKIYLTRSDMREYKYIEQTLLSVLQYILPLTELAYFKTRGDER